MAEPIIISEATGGKRCWNKHSAWIDADWLIEPPIDECGPSLYSCDDCVIAALWTVQEYPDAQLDHELAARQVATEQNLIALIREVRALAAYGSGCDTAAPYIREHIDRELAHLGISQAAP